jgi:hypothetical protein
MHCLHVNNTAGFLPPKGDNMRFEENAEHGFKPFKITVETQEEANYLYALVAATSDKIDNMFKVDGNELYYYLEQKVHSDSLPSLHFQP